MITPSKTDSNINFSKGTPSRAKIDKGWHPLNNLKVTPPRAVGNITKEDTIRHGYGCKNFITAM
jgi:hypothetical protein